MPYGGLGIYTLYTTGIDGVGMGALEMQILAALETSGGPLLGQTGAAWTVEKTQPHDAPPGSERCSPNPMWGFPRRFLTGFSRLSSWLSELRFSFCLHVWELLSPCATRGQMHQPSKSSDGMGPAVQGPQGVPRGRSAQRLSQSHVQRRGRQAGARPLEKDPAIRSKGNSDAGPCHPTEPAGGWLPRFPMQWARRPLPPFRKGPGGTARSFLLQD